MSELWESATDLKNPGRADALSELFDELWDQEKRGEAIQVGYVLIDVSSENCTPDEYLGHTIRVAQCLNLVSLEAESIDLINSCLEALDFIDDESKLGELYFLQGVNYKDVSMFELAVENFSLAVRYYEAFDTEANQAFANYWKAHCQKKLGSFEEAKSCFARSIELFEIAKRLPEVAVAKKEMAMILDSQGYSKLALGYFKESRSIYTFLNNLADAQECTFEMGRCHWDLGNTDEAQHLFGEAQALKQTTFMQVTAAKAEFHLAISLIDCGEFELGAEMMREIFPVLIALGQEDLANQAATYC